MVFESETPHTDAVYVESKPLRRENFERVDCSESLLGCAAGNIELPLGAGGARSVTRSEHVGQRRPFVRLGVVHFCLGKHAALVGVALRRRRR